MPRFAKIDQLTDEVLNIEVWQTKPADTELYRYEEGDGHVLVQAEPGLDYRKHYRSMLVDNRTTEGIEEGYTYSGMLFSASRNHQTWTLGLKDDIVNDGLDATGIPVPNKDNSQTYVIADNADALSLIAACKLHVRTWLVSGATLKQQIMNAATQDVLDAIVDNR